MTGVVSPYRRTANLPTVISVFPLDGILLLPRTLLPLNVFEPRYRAMVDHALSNHRIIGMFQPDQEARRTQRPPHPPLSRVGCAGRITAYRETDDGRISLSLTGICRFAATRELTVPTPFRQVEADYAPFAGDLAVGSGEEAVDRAALLGMLHAYIDANGLTADWSEVEATSNEYLVNSLAMLSPYGPADKQALLQAPDLGTRAALLIALAERRLSTTLGAHPLRLQ